MSLCPVANGIESGPIGSEVVHDEETSGLEEPENDLLRLVRRVLEAPAVQEHEPEWAQRRGRSRRQSPTRRSTFENGSSLRVAISAR